MAVRASYDDVAASLDVCSISWWRGYMTSTFYAATEDGEVVAESPSFRWRGRTAPPADEAARAAHDSLVESLEDAGWTSAGIAGPWFATRFTRPGTKPRPVPAPVVVEPRPAPVLVEPVAVVEQPAPPPMPAPVPEPAPVPAAPTEPRRTRRLRVFSAVFAVVAVGAFAYLALQPSPKHTVTRVQPPKTHAPRVTHASAPARPAPPVRRVVRVTIAAGDRGSWLEVRSGSAKGRVLYSGVLEPGKRLTYRAPRLWARFGAAGNLTITQNGRPITLLGTYEHVFRG